MNQTFPDKQINFASFGLDQIWSQIENLTETRVKKAVKRVEGLAKHADEMKIEMPEEEEEAKIQEEEEYVDEFAPIEGEEEEEELSELDMAQMEKDLDKQDLEAEDENPFGEPGSSDDDLPGFDQIEEMEDNEEKKVTFGDFYKKGEEEVKGEAMIEGDEEIDEDDLFNEARQKGEMENLLNKEKLDQIDEIEDEMAGGKTWKNSGEVMAKQRPMNSLLNEALDFDVAAKIPEKGSIKQNNSVIEKMIKQRFIDGLFDDPVRKAVQSERKKVRAEDLMDFEKSKKGLGELYEDDYREKVLGENLHPEEEDTQKELDELLGNLWYQLDKLSSTQFTPKPKDKEAGISTQNVEAFKMEEQVPVGSGDAAKSAKDVYQSSVTQMADPEELNRAEKKAERAKRKRKIRSHLKQKERKIQEERRKSHMPMNDKFETKQLAKAMKKKAKTRDTEVKKNEHKSKNFFTKMQKVSVSDADRKGKKRMAPAPTGSSKKFKS